MQTAKKILFKIFPMVLSAVLAMGLIFSIYINVMDSQTENCWERLDDGATNLALRVKRSFNDNLNLLGRVADAISIQENQSKTSDVTDYIKTVRENTIYERIDILYSDNELLREDGSRIPMTGQIPFSELEKRGTHISSRYTDHFNDSEVVYCVAPIKDKGETSALLIGVIECDSMKDYFSMNLYGESSQIFVIDRTDGKFLLDNWNPYLGSLSDLGTRDKLPEYENVDFASDIMNGIKGRFAFISKQNGNVSYMTYVPIDEDKFSWTVAVMVQEDIAMENVSRLEGYMRIVALIITLFVLVYITWNIFIVSKSLKNEERARAAEVEREKNRAKSIFLSSMSHDIRTPLNGIVGMLDVIDAHKNEPLRVEDCLAKIRVSANYLTTLADDIIDINEMESGKLVLVNHPFNIYELIERVNIIVNGRAKDAGISYYVSTDGIMNPAVIGSEPHIQRVLINLIGNAVKYNKENGSVWLTADEVGEGEGKRYRFTVRDNGIGMSEEFQKNMFLAFEQENSGARTTYRGHGLGLTIVHRLVTEMKGDILVESTEGVGTAFTVLLPLAEDKGEAKDSEAQQTTAEKSLSGMKILVAEDNEINMEIAKVILVEEGASVTAAQNGIEAVDAFRRSEEWEIDLILMDIMMPELDGKEASRRIRAMERDDARHIPIVAMSAAAFADDIRLCADAGMNEHISKPLDTKALLRIITKYKKTKTSN